MRINTYVKLEAMYKRYRGYVRTRELLEEGFTNRQIAFLTEEGYLEKICHGSYRIYDIERSICDVRRLEPQMKLEIIDCVRNNEQRYKRLLKYAELLRVKQFLD